MTPLSAVSRPSRRLPPRVLRPATPSALSQWTQKRKRAEALSTTGESVAIPGMKLQVEVRSVRGGA